MLSGTGATAPLCDRATTKSRAATALIAVAAALAIVAFTAPRATALTDGWHCTNYYSAQTCWSGAGYHSWVEIWNDPYDYRYAVCAKGRTEAGNTRTGADDGCSYNTSFRVTCFSYELPLSAAYVYWAGTGGALSEDGLARTPSDRYFC